MIKEVTLSGGYVAKVKRLPLFALDKIRVEPLGPYTYEIVAVNGEKYTVPYDGSTWDKPPEKPTFDERGLQEGGDEWFQWVEYHRYQAWLVHEEKRSQIMVEYAQSVAQYIMDHAIDEETQDHIFTDEDWGKIHTAALVPEVTEEDLSATLRTTFHGILVGDAAVPGAAPG